MSHFSVLSPMVFSAMLLFCGCRERVHRVEWETMGTIAALQWRGDGDARLVLSDVKESFAQVAEKLNAHDPDSEISRMAKYDENEILKYCSPEMKKCYEAAFEMMRRSCGAFNPGWKGKNTLDFGAIAKGYALDMAREEIKTNESLGKYGEKTPDLLLDLGGSLYAVKGSWKVGVLQSDDIIVLDEGCACATSATYFRGKHIYDGRTLKPVTNDLNSLTVVTRGNATLADALSTTLFIMEGEDTSALIKNNHETKVYKSRSASPNMCVILF